MGYPYGDTYLEQIQKNKYDCKKIRDAFWVLAQKYKRVHGLPTGEELTLTQYFEVLGETFEHESVVLDSCTDPHHFVWDVLDALLGPEFDD